MTEQEFRELTAYQSPSPSPKAYGPAVASVAAAVAAVKTPTNNAAQEPHLSEQTAQAPGQLQIDQTQMAADAQMQIQATAQDHAQAHGQPQAESPAPTPQNASFEMVPLRKHEELMEQYARLSDRFKRLVEERDSLSRQVSELKRSAAAQDQAGAQGRDYKEEIRLLGKLIDDEQSLRSSAKPGDEFYARHDRLVNVFLNIVARHNNP